MTSEHDVGGLWEALDKKGQGWLSEADLRQGLRDIDHPLWSADALSQDAFKAMEMDNDSRISRQHFEQFVQTANSTLQDLFKSLPKQQDGRVSKDDLRKALKRSAVTIPSARLDEFFQQVDTSQTGTLCYEEWRDFLVFSPTAINNLDDTFSSYHSRTLRWSHDSNVHIDEDSRNQIGPIGRYMFRLKIYLIAQTKIGSAPAHFSWQRSPFRALVQSTYPIKDACISLWEAGGVYSLWAGNGLNIVKMLPEGAIKFGFYEASKLFFANLQGVKDPSQISGWAQFASGGIGGIAAQFAAYPVDTLRFRMQCELVRGGVQGNRLLLQTAKKMWSSGGIRSYYRGLWWGLVGQFPYSAIDLTTFEYTKQWLVRRNEREGLNGKDTRPGPVAIAAVGGFSGAFGASMVWPLNMLRTRLQTQGTVIHPRTYTGLLDVTKQTLRDEGVRGFFRGIGPNLIKVVPAVSITYVVYDQSKQALGLE